MHLRLPAPLAMTCVRPHLKCMLSLELASETFQTASSNLTISISKSFSKTGYTIHSPLFVLTIVEIEDFALRGPSWMIVSVKSALGAAPSVHILGNGKMAAQAAKSLNHVVSFAAVIRVVIGEKRCVTSLITAAKETINMTIFQKIGDCERPKDWCTSQDLLTQLESFCRAIYGNKSGIAELNQRRNLQMNGSTLLRRNNVLSIVLRLVKIGYLKVISSKSFLFRGYGVPVNAAPKLHPSRLANQKRRHMFLRL